MVFARSAAMAFNRLADRHIDAKNPRTATRHLPAGTLSVATVWLFTLICCAGFVASTLLFYFREPSNPWPLYLAGAGAALRPRLLAREALHEPRAPLARRGTRARARRGLDRGEGADRHDRAAASWARRSRSGWRASTSSMPARTPTSTGRKGCTASRRGSACRRACASRPRATRSCSRLLVGLSFASPHLGTVFLCGLAAVGLLLIYEHRLVRADDLTRVNRAFFHVNGVISVGLLLLVLVQLAVR